MIPQEVVDIREILMGSITDMNKEIATRIA